MTLEERLSELGEQPFSNTPNFRSVLAYINGSFTKAALPLVTSATPGDVILQQIYAMNDLTLQALMLERPMRELKGDTKFKNILLYTGILITILVITVATISLFGSTPLSPELIDLFKSIAVGLLELVKGLLTS